MQFSLIPEELFETYSKRLASVDRWGNQATVNLLCFDSWCRKTYPDATGMTQEMVDAWCAKRPTEKNNSCRSRIYPVVEFVRYLRERGIAELSDPEIPRHEPSTYVPHAFTEPELRSFFGACDSWPVTNNTARSKNLALTLPVFFRLLYSSGIRTTEARLLRREDVDLESGVLDIKRSKGHCQHFVAMHDSMTDLMRRYDESIRLLYPTRAHFFPRNSTEGRTAAWVSKTFRRLWRQVSDERATAYELRHNYAIENIDGWVGTGFDFFDRLTYLSRSMGHSDVETTRRYYALVPALADLIEDRCGDDLDDIFPEVGHEEAE